MNKRVTSELESTFYSKDEIIKKRSIRQMVLKYTSYI